MDLQPGFPDSWTRLVPQALSEVLVWWQKATRSATANEGGDSSCRSSTSRVGSEISWSEAGDPSYKV